VVKAKKEDEQEQLVLVAAYLASEGKKQREIGVALGVSQPEVSRLLEAARTRKLLVPARPILTCTEEERQEVVTRFFSSGAILDRLRKLEGRFAGTLRRVTVAHSDRSRCETLAALLGEAHVVGVTWGGTIRRTVEMLRDHLPEPSRTGAVQFVPLCGEPLRDWHDPVQYSSTALASELGALLGGKERAGHLSLAGVPAIIPPQFTKASELKTIRRFIAQVGSYRAIFGGEGAAGRGGERPLVERLDTILTSIGVVEAKYRGIWLREWVELGVVSEALLSALVVADVGGVMVPKAGLSAARERRIAGMMKTRWTGIQRKQLERCAREERPGVIVLALGAWRVGAVRRIVELGLVNELVIDAELAEGLKAD
jgi:DNA-binding transcriptional regulator LsrR (DeoR family)